MREILRFPDSEDVLACITGKHFTCMQSAPVLLCPGCFMSSCCYPTGLSFCLGLSAPIGMDVSTPQRGQCQPAVGTSWQDGLVSVFQGGGALRLPAFPQGGSPRQGRAGLAFALAGGDPGGCDQGWGCHLLILSHMPLREEVTFPGSLEVQVALCLRRTHVEGPWQWMTSVTVCPSLEDKCEPIISLVLFFTL